MSTQVQVRYFAILREQRGVNCEIIATNSVTPRQLYAELALKHDFTLMVEQLNVAVNGKFACFDDNIKDGDTVVFIPPIAGG